MKTINFENVLEDFNFLENWEDKYRYIIDIDKELEKYLKISQNYRLFDLYKSVGFVSINNGQKSFHLEILMQIVRV